MLAENAELVAVMDSNMAAAASVNEKYKAVYAFDNVEDLLDLDKIQAVYIARPVFCHKDQAIKAAKAETLEMELGNMYTKEIGQFGVAIQQGTEFLITAGEEIASQRIIEAAYGSDGKKLYKIFKQY